MISKSLCNNLYRLQKDCMKLIAKEKRNSNADPLFSNFKIIRFPDLIESELCKLGYKLDRKMLLIPVVDLFHRNNSKKMHKYNTRQKSLPNVQRHTTPLFNKSFLCKSLTLYGKLPTKVKQQRSVEMFCKNLKCLKNNQQASDTS